MSERRKSPGALLLPWHLIRTNTWGVVVETEPREARWSHPGDTAWNDLPKQPED